MNLQNILNQFNKTLRQLDKFVDINIKTVVRNSKDIDRLQEENQKLIQDNSQASLVANNIRDLLGVSK